MWIHILEAADFTCPSLLRQSPALDEEVEGESLVNEPA